MEQSENYDTRRMTRADLDEVAQLYCERLSSSTYARLGRSFVREVLAGILDSPQGKAVVVRLGESLLGFIAAATDMEKMYRGLRRKRGLSLAWKALWGIIKQPGLLNQVRQTGSYFERVGHADIPAELLYIAVRWDRQGAKLASLLLAAMLAELHQSGVKQVKVTTELENKPPQNLLWAFGFEQGNTFEFYGKKMTVLFHRDLAAARMTPLPEDDR